jgi:hypothetical protein
MFRKKFFLLFFILLVGCRGGGGEQSAPTPREESTMPQIKKIAIRNKAEADSLINLGVEVIVVEDTYVAVRVDSQATAKIESINLKLEPIKEEELVQRLVKITPVDAAGRQALADLGIDIWEVRQDTVIAQVFDKHIREVEARGYRVEILERNVLNVVKKSK